MSGGAPCQVTYCGILREYRKLQTIYSQNYGQVMTMNAPHDNSLGHERALNRETLPWRLGELVAHGCRDKVTEIWR